MFPLFLAAVLAAPPDHQTDNPLFKSLLDPGLVVGAEHKAKLPAPSMPDGLDAARQKAVITGLIGNDYSYEDFTRKSVVAPQLLKLSDVMPSDPKAPARGVDVWFVAYGDLKATEDDKFLEQLVNMGRGEGKGGTLTKDELARRKIDPVDLKRERFGYVEFDFLDKVRIRATGRAVWSRTQDSVVVAAEIDSRFRGDADFPNQWRPLTREGAGLKAGAPSDWGGAAFYLKVTKLVEPAGALFVEQHIVFAEPTGWFDGANLLRSKLPPVVQRNVRNMRAEWVKASGK